MITPQNIDFKNTSIGEIRSLFSTIYSALSINQPLHTTPIILAEIQLNRKVIKRL